MADNARISSVESVELFRSKLIVFLEQVRPVLEEVGSELARTQGWLQDDQRRFWEMELRKRQRKLEEANYVSVKKEFVERKPVSWYALSPAGRAALKEHLRGLESLIKAAGI
jgi:hypothetical protein